ncbi:MAG: DsbA family oxidoreductase [Acidimicrobiales bacterium]
MKIEIWSDVACPWCYIGKRRFDAALGRFEHRDAVHVRYRSFELDPAAPAVREVPYLDHLMAKYRISMAEADAMIDRLIEAGARNGVVLRLDKARPGNTFDAHRLLHLAAERGLQVDLKDKLLRATFTKGAAIADHEVLVEVATAAGLDAAEARGVLTSTAYGPEVRDDERRAADLGITSVPYFVMGGLGVAGAQPPEVLLEVLHDAWDEAAQASS